MTVAYIGVDPGAKGAITLLWRDHIETHNINEPVKLNALLSHWTLLYDDILALVEKQWARRENGVTNAFARGGNYKSLLVLLAINHIPTIEIAPSTWKTTMGLSSDKQASIDLARELYWNADLRTSSRARKDSDDRAESILLAHLARETYGSEEGLGQWSS